MFFNAKEEPTRYKYLIYYTFSFLENSAIIAVWFLHTPSRYDAAAEMIRYAHNDPTPFSTHQLYRLL